MLVPLAITQWQHVISDTIQKQAIQHLENGHLLYFPQLAFTLSSAETALLSPDYADPQAKNICYHPVSHCLQGTRPLTDQIKLTLQSMLARYSSAALSLVQQLFPSYVEQLTIGRVSFRPIQIKGRITSARQDDKQLHVDAFPATPSQGNRLLRIFSNINPEGEDRLWLIGEPFEKMAARFLSILSSPWIGWAWLLHALKITKSKRTLYDHYMLQIHDHMKANQAYQQSVPQQTVLFPPGSTWIVQTDEVSHAVLEGQYALEQTFYVPIEAMQHPERSPLRILECLTKQTLR